MSDEEHTSLGKNELIFFRSIEEAAQYEAEKNASVSGIAHLQSATAFMRILYQKELAEKREFKLYFELDDRH